MSKNVPHKSKAPWVVTLVVTLLAVSSAGAYFFRYDKYRTDVVQEGVLYRDGMRNTREFGNMLRDVKPKTVVCLVTDDEISRPEKGDFQGEVELLKSRGIKYERVPVPLGGPPSDEAIDKFLSIVQDKENQPVVVHCAQGVVRTGMMVAAYQERVLGYDREKAIAAVNIFGKSETRGVRVRWFIDRYYAQRHPEQFPTPEAARAALAAPARGTPEVTE